MSSSVTDEPLELRELLDIEGFRDVCRSTSELYGIGIKVFDAQGQKLVDVRTADVNLTGYLFKLHDTQVLFTNLVNQLRTHPLEPRSKPVAIDDFCGLRYMVLPIVHDASVVGRIIFGPFAPPSLERPPRELERFQPALDLPTLTKLLSDIPRATDDQMELALGHLRTVIEVIIHASFKTVMTSRLHIASITAAFEDLQRSNNELERANDQLRELDRMKSNFIATVSHELRTPLTSVIGYSEMLLENMAGDLRPEQREYVKTILEKGESLLNLIGQVLDMSRIESGNVHITKAMTDPKELVRLCISDIVPQAQKREIVIDTRVDDVPPIKVDADKIRRAVTNLLGNAVKFTNPGGRVSLSLRVEDDRGGRFDPFQPEHHQNLRIDVTDTGIGIPSDMLDRVFDSFFQVDNSSTRQFGGTGLGLSIAQNFVRAHGGRIEVKSAVGEGSTFTILVPYQMPEASAVEAADALQEARL